MGYKEDLKDYDSSDIKTAISESVHNSLRRKILHQALVNGKTYENIGVLVDRSTRHVLRIMKEETPTVKEWLDRKMS